MKRTALFGAYRRGFRSGPRARRHELHQLRGRACSTSRYDSVDVDGDGFALGGSYELNDQFHLFGVVAGPEPRLRHRRPLARARRRLEPQLLGQAGLRRHAVVRRCRGEARQPTADDDGLALGGGIRTRVARVVRARRMAQVRRLRRVGQRHGLSRSVAATTSTTAWLSARASTSTTTPIRCVSASVGSSKQVETCPMRRRLLRSRRRFL